MKIFWVKVNYADKSFQNIKVKTTNNTAALLYVLNNLSETEKDKVVGVKVFKIEE